MEEFKILSIDGGGIRGVYPVAYLKYIEDKIEGNIYEYFDMIVGTSTGAIIALALALNIGAKEILRLYEKKGRTIFSISPRLLTRGILFPKYSNAELINELKSLYKESTLIKECKTRVCIPTINITSGQTIVRKTRHHNEFFHDLDLPVWQVASESSAAPGFFPSFEDENKCQYIDGGLWANNPSLVGLAEALKIGCSIDKIKILSLGTGNKILHKDGWKSKVLGLIGYGTSLVDITFQTQAQGVRNITKYLLKDNYIRIDYSLPKTKHLIFFDKFGLDKVCSINSLINFAYEEAKKTFSSVQSEFFKNKVPVFEPVPLKTGEL